MFSKQTLVITGILLSTTAFADAPDTSTWVCQFCPFPEGHDASIDAGASYATEDSAYFGDASGYDEKGTYLDLNGEGSYDSGTYRARWGVENLGVDSRRAYISGGNQGLYGYSLSYQELPRRQFDTTRTIFLQSAPDSLSLPSGWQRAPLTSGFTALDSSLADSDVGSKRKSLEIAARYTPLRALDVSFSYRRAESDGVNITAGSYFTQSSLLLQPIDHSTDNLEIGARLAFDRGYIVAAYYGSFFENRFTGTSWDSPFTTAVGAETGRLAQAPENHFQQLSLSGAVRFDAYNISIGFRGAVGRVTQDDILLPYTTNGSLATTPLPRTSLDGEVDKRNLAVSVSATPIDRLRVNLRFRHDRRDNNTPVETWTRVISETFISGESEENVPYSFRRNRLNLSASYPLFRNLNVSAGYDRTENDRDFQEVAEQTEDVGWGALRWRPHDLIEVRAKGGVAKREIDRYDETFAATLGQNPLMRKYNLAHRYRRYGEVTVAAAAAERPISLSATAAYADDDYSLSSLGLLDGTDLRISGDLSFTLSEKGVLYIQAGFEDIDSTQAGSEQFSFADWSANNSDRFYTAGAGMTLDDISDSVDLSIHYLRSVGTTEISMLTAGGASDFPDLESTLDTVRILASWQKSPRMTFNFAVRYQRFSMDDWALQDVGPDAIPTVLTLGARPYDYDRFLLGVGLSYSVN